MKSPRVGLLIIGLIVGVLCIRPVGTLLIRSEVQRRTGAQLSMDRCQFNMLTGGVAIEGAVIEPGSENIPGETSQYPPIKIARIWSKGSLNKLLYRKLSAPITVMDGIEIELSNLDEIQVPAVQPATPFVRNTTLLLTPHKNVLIDELNHAFQKTQEAISQDRFAYSNIGKQLEAIENRSLSLENPLRDRDAISAAQQSIENLQRELDRARSLLDQNRESFQQTSLAIPMAAPKNVEETPSDNPLARVDEHADLKIQARGLAESLVCASVGRMKPYLGLSATLTRQCLMDSSRCESCSPQQTGPHQMIADRGINYGFGSMNKSDIVFGSVRLRGTAKIDERKLPFSGQLRNVGNQGLEIEERPTLNLAFATQDKLDFEAPSIAVKSSIVPDRQGFQIQSQMVPTGSMIASVAVGDWKLAAFGQNSTVNLVWLVHQSEWSLTVDIRSSQSEVVVKRNALLAMPVQDEWMPRYESCYQSVNAVSLAKAHFQGNIEKGVPSQRSLRFESPFLDGLAESMMEQQRILENMGIASDRQKTQEAFDQSLSSYQVQVDETHRALVAVHEKLQSKLRSFESKINDVSPGRDDLRFSRGSAESILR